MKYMGLTETAYLEKASKALRRRASPERAKIVARFFKTGPGQYGEGDVFLGVSVPDTRSVAKKYDNLSIPEIKQLLSSEIHEDRLLALLMLVERFRKVADKKAIVDFYLSNTEHVNNWDLVDLSAHQILGEFLIDKSRKMLYRLAKSKSVWERRISIIATYAFIRRRDFRDTFGIAGTLLADRHDLIQKAVGWMLREVGKRDQDAEEAFLARHSRKMPRTMLRYAVERFDERKRVRYLS